MWEWISFAIGAVFLGLYGYALFTGRAKEQGSRRPGGRGGNRGG